MKLEAYDYKKQCWVEGQEARELLARQVEAEIKLLTGPQGKTYFKFIQPKSYKLTFKEYLSMLRGRLQEILGAET